MGCKLVSITNNALPFSIEKVIKVYKNRPEYPKNSVRYNYDDRFIIVRNDYKISMIRKLRQYWRQI